MRSSSGDGDGDSRHGEEQLREEGSNRQGGAGEGEDETHSRADDGDVDSAEDSSGDDNGNDNDNDNGNGNGNGNGMSKSTTATAAMYDDLLFYAEQFAASQSFSKEKRAVVQTIAHKLWEACLSTPFNNVDETVALLRDQLIKHSVHRPPWSEGILTYSDCQCVLDYFLRTFFAHFKLYKMACTRQITLAATADTQPDPPAKTRRPLSHAVVRPPSSPKPTSAHNRERPISPTETTASSQGQEEPPATTHQTVG
ncbi:hypothetical protein PTSG_04954 [Salpingoeca rosetta]|uniref:Uncharacterized protein n=1 Tax=Salpingoeca rosetta (strain ATCC 50818 / BSB-021) TaxID=946362 RepID=F2U935_SALR5|nr:uncharacterized protein PTSG_04954 [Salpingoeca rosetta]EGD73238.1 hypothetical protein PTSG_04954 [Salpingoeca rosetta]|eukprot:XP_004994269.1 hypothetical protein PTSG_04954 [Salpingoeca rosetta]